MSGSEGPRNSPRGPTTATGVPPEGPSRESREMIIWPFTGSLSSWEILPRSKH